MWYASMYHSLCLIYCYVCAWMFGPMKPLLHFYKSFTIIIQVIVLVFWLAFSYQWFTIIWSNIDYPIIDCNFFIFLHYCSICGIVYSHVMCMNIKWIRSSVCAFIWQLFKWSVLSLYILHKCMELFSCYWLYLCLLHFGIQ